MTLSLEPAPGFAAAADRGVLVVLDTSLSPELVTEGQARAVVRLIQNARKRAGFDVSDRISVRYSAANGVAQAFEQHAAYIRRETLAKHMHSRAEALGDPVVGEGRADHLSFSSPTSRFSLVSRARKTSPMPPAPSGAAIS